MAVEGLKGIDNVMRNLNKEMAKMKVKSLAGLIRAAALIRVDMDKTPPLIPVDTGNLRGSWFVTTGKVPGGGPFVTIGFQAIYASLVHEMIESKSGKPINWNRPGSGAYFFTSAMNNGKAYMSKIIANSIRF